MTRYGVPTGVSVVMLSVPWAQPMRSAQTRPAPVPRPSAELLRLSLAAAKTGLAEPFETAR